MKYYTLGPTGSCHEHALKAYLEFKNIEKAEIHLVSDLVEAAEKAAKDKNAYVLQCSAHLNVHLITERFRNNLPVVDTFIYPTRPIAIIKRRNIYNPRTIGIPEAALGYIDTSQWEEIIFESTKPIVAQNLLMGKYDAGVAYTQTAIENPNEIEITKEIGEVVTTWIVYGPTPRYNGGIIVTNHAKEQSHEIYNGGD